MPGCPPCLFLFFGIARGVEGADLDEDEPLTAVDIVGTAGILVLCSSGLW